VVDKFRAYASYAEAFTDYANLLKSNPRYSAALQAGNDPKAFAQGLQKAGYATDPSYASKLHRIITGSVMRQGLSA
jgi:flagellar protein FlgJ